jgi:hypothetical protein
MIEPGLPALRPLRLPEPYCAAVTCTEVHPGGAAELPADSLDYCEVCGHAGRSIDERLARLYREAERERALLREARAREFRKALAAARRAKLAKGARKAGRWIA